MFTHLGFVVAPAVWVLAIAFASSRELVAVELNSQSRLFLNADASVRDWNSPAGNNLVLV
jgi:hypothetical protein